MFQEILALYLIYVYYRDGTTGCQVLGVFIDPPAGQLSLTVKLGFQTLRGFFRV